MLVTVVSEAFLEQTALCIPISLVSIFLLPKIYTTFVQFVQIHVLYSSCGPVVCDAMW